MSYTPTDYNPYDFANRRHIGPTPDEMARMLQAVGCDSLDQLIDQTIPADMRQPDPLTWPALSEGELLDKMRAVGAKNTVMTSLIGQGYYGTVTPPAILRNIFENPAWYTAYTPYQPEIAQGRLEALLNFQTMVSDLTGLPVANASLLDEATACAEAMVMAQRGAKSKAMAFFVDENCHPQNIAVVQTRAEPLGIEVIVGAPEDCPADRVFAGLFQYPGTYGDLRDFRPQIEALHANKALAIMATDLLALTMIVEPGALGADIAVGSAQRFGVPMGYGGPHAAFIACRDAYKRSMPGRIVGRQRRCAWQPSLSFVAANARAAYPARKGHVQCLHRAGAAGGDGLDVCCVPRPQGPARDCRAGAWADRAALSRTQHGRRRCYGERLLRHDHGQCRCRTGRYSGGCAGRRAEFTQDRRGPCWHLA